MLSSRRLLALFVVIVGFPSLAFAQRAPSLGSSEFRHSSSLPVFSSSISSPRNSVSSMSIGSSRSTLNIRSASFYDEHRFAQSTGEQIRLDKLVPIEVTTTPFATESKVPVAPLLGARLQLHFSVMTVRNANVMLGPLPASELLHAPAQARSPELYGFGVNIPLGRGTHLETSNNILQSVMRIVRRD